MNSKVSIVIPVYNVGMYLADCLESILAQTYKNLEILCVDDGSTDGSGTILADFSNRDKRIRVITQSNAGQSAARNRGMKLASGTWFYPVDSDDLLLPDAIEWMVRTAETYQLDELHFNRQVFFEPGVAFDSYETQTFACGKYSGVYTGPELFVRMMRKKDFQVCIWMRFFRLEYLKKNNLQFHEGIIHEDEAFAVAADLLATRAMRYPEKICYRRRVRAGSTMTGMSAMRHFQGCLSARRDLMDFLRTHKITLEAENAVRRRAAGLLLSAEDYRNDLPMDKSGDIMFEMLVAEAKDFLRNAEQRDERNRQGSIRRFFLCLKENGLKYTILRLFRSKDKKWM